MAYEPQSVLGLCEELGLRPNELLLNCVFCFCILAYEEVWSFIHRGFKIVWKKSWPYGICLKCVCFYATLDNLRYHQRSAYTETVEAETGFPIEDLQLRCACCWAVLTLLEKQWMKEYKRRYHNIAGQWRGVCFFCSRPRRIPARLGPRHRRMQQLFVHPHIQQAWRP